MITLELYSLGRYNVVKSGLFTDGCYFPDEVNMLMLMCLKICANYVEIWIPKGLIRLFELEGSFCI